MERSRRGGRELGGKGEGETSASPERSLPLPARVPFCIVYYRGVGGASPSVVP